MYFGTFGKHSVAISCKERWNGISMAMLSARPKEKDKRTGEEKHFGSYFKIPFDAKSQKRSPLTENSFCGTNREDLFQIDFFGNGHQYPSDRPEGKSRKA